MDMAEVNPDYMQIRYIDAQGLEVVRIDRDKTHLLFSQFTHVTK